MNNRIKIGDLINQGIAHSQTGPFGTQLKASEYVDSGIPVINVRNIGFGDIRESNLEFITKAKAYELGSALFIRMDILKKWQCGSIL